ncbi:acid protease [Westerdykella ornata]|uniref:Acid protease n=1 Tax=Westerdykella ornata TaxID=318751 RepID=A0A6A6JJ45_WESOR|nr:acid protease [Westerdykella ornata]KAF2276143.1 acid protease [Westerdykella ornata]
MIRSTTAVFVLAYAVLSGAASADKTVSLPLWSVLEGKGCATNISIGSNNEGATVLVYTNAEHLWINPSCATKKEGASEKCESRSSYSPKDSQTAKESGNPGDWITYSMYYDASNGIGTGNVDGILGTSYQDTVTVGGKTVEGLRFGVAETPRNLLYGELSITASQTKESSGGALIDALVNQGQINSRVFSLQVPVEDRQGSLIFGGFDKKKYKCQLSNVPLIIGSTPSESPQYRTFLHGIAQTLPNKTKPSYTTLLPTTGLEISLSSELLYNVLPDPLFLAIGNDFPQATLIDNHPSKPDQRLFNVPCKDIPEGSIDFRFAGPTVTDNDKAEEDGDDHKNGNNNEANWISIPYKDFIITDDKGTCWLRMVTRKDQGPALSQSFFRSAYTVFDIDNGQVWMGQADDCGSEVVEVGKGESAVGVAEGCNCDKRDGRQKPKVGSAVRVGKRKMDLWLIVLLVWLLTVMDYS